jgi:hypothetical protein
MSSNLVQSLVNQENPPPSTTSGILQALGLRSAQQPKHQYDEYSIAELDTRLNEFINICQSLTSQQKTELRQRVTKLRADAGIPDNQKKELLLFVTKSVRAMDVYMRLKKDIIPKAGYSLQKCDKNTEAGKTEAGKSEAAPVADSTGAVVTVPVEIQECIVKGMPFLTQINICTSSGSSVKECIQRIANASQFLGDCCPKMNKVRGQIPDVAQFIDICDQAYDSGSPATTTPVGPSATTAPGLRGQKMSGPPPQMIPNDPNVLVNKVGNLAQCILVKEISKTDYNQDVVVSAFMLLLNCLCIRDNILFSSVVESAGDQKWVFKGIVKEQWIQGGKQAGLSDNEINVADSPLDMATIGQYLKQMLSKRPPSAEQQKCELCFIPGLEVES